MSKAPDVFALPLLRMTNASNGFVTITQRQMGIPFGGNKSLPSPVRLSPGEEFGFFKPEADVELVVKFG